MENNLLDFYHIHKKGEYISKALPYKDYTIFSWTISPSGWKETVIILHGFLDHSFSNYTFINWLLERGYRVLAADMPGHGKSGGTRGGIDDFSEYQEYFQLLLEQWEIDESRTFALGHSTGASILIDYARYEGRSFRGMIFVAPLVKINYYAFVDKGIDLAHTKIKDMAIRKNRSCRNKAFLRFKWEDPLGVKRFSLSWVKAMVEWNRNWKDFQSDVPVLILQGRKDTTVEWKSNLPLLKKSFDLVRIIIYPRGRHHLLNEFERLRQRVYKDIESFLVDPDGC